MPTVSTGMFRWLYGQGASLEDFADRLNHIWAFGLLLLLACVVCLRHTFISPINCFTPREFAQSQVTFCESHCWNSHFISFLNMTDRNIDNLDYMRYPLLTFKEHEYEDRLEHVTLYQWLPLMFCFQALLFKLPSIIMYILHGYSGVSFEKISSLTEGYGNLNMADRHLLGRQVGRYIYNWCFQFNNCLPWRLLTLVWLLVKTLYAVNAIVQLVIFNNFMYPTEQIVSNSTTYGDVITDNLFRNNVTIWRNAMSFPRQVFCEIELVRLQNVLKYVIQCDLPANEANETICMFLWVWLTFVAVVTCGSLAVWILNTLLPFARKRFVSKTLFLSEEINPHMVADHELHEFSSLVGEDGVMALKMIGSNSSDHVVRDAVTTMWNMRMVAVRGRVYQPDDDKANETSRL